MSDEPVKKPARPAFIEKTEENIEAVAQQRLDILNVRKRASSNPRIIEKIKAKEKEIEEVREQEVQAARARKRGDIPEIVRTKEEKPNAPGQGDRQARSITGQEHPRDKTAPQDL